MGKDFMNREGTPDSGPAEPEKRSPGSRMLRLILFGLLLVYILIAAFHVQILTAIGSALVVEHEISKSDLIVCMAGSNIERGLETADLYHDGYAPRVFVAPEQPPEGLDVLKSRGIRYPETIDLLVTLLQDLGVPRSAIMISQRPSSSTRSEADMVRELVEKGDCRSIILVTSPTHTRRTYLAVSKLVEGKDVRIRVVPSRYSGFRAEEWWKHRKYAREVILEYQKLAYYYVKELR